MALKPFHLIVPELIKSNLNHEIYKEDANKLVRRELVWENRRKAWGL